MAGPIDSNVGLIGSRVFRMNRKVSVKNTAVIHVENIGDGCDQWIRRFVEPSYLSNT